MANTPSLNFLNGEATVAVTNDDGTSFSVDFEPDPNVMGNAMFETNNGISETVVTIHNGWFASLVLVIVIVLVAALVINRSGDRVSRWRFHTQQMAHEEVPAPANEVRIPTEPVGPVGQDQ